MKRIEDVSEKFVNHFKGGRKMKTGLTSGRVLTCAGIKLRSDDRCDVQGCDKKSDVFILSWLQVPIRIELCEEHMKSVALFRGAFESGLVESGASVTVVAED